MGRTIATVDILAILFLFIFSFSMLTYSKQETLEIEQLKLDYALNYAVDAATQEMLDRSGNLDMSEANIEHVQVEPAIALRTFADVFLTNYKLKMDEGNRQMIRTQFLPLFLVAADDGYYMGSLQQIDSDPKGIGYDLQFTPKLPYSFTEGDAVYGLTLSQKYNYKVKETATGVIDFSYTKGNANIPPSLQSSVIANPDYEAKNEWPVYVQKQNIQREINMIVADHIAKVMFQYTLSDYVTGGKAFFIPADIAKITNTNPIQGISVLAIIQHCDLGSYRGLSTLSVGGAKILPTRYVVGYKDPVDGIKYYAYADKIPVGQVTPLEVFKTPIAAAQRGYYCDYKYMFNPEKFREVGTEYVNR